MIRHPPISTLFPYTPLFRSSVYATEGESALDTRFRQECALLESIVGQSVRSVSVHNPSVHRQYVLFPGYRNAYDPEIFGPDRNSTRLNSSHANISYAVFCLK